MMESIWNPKITPSHLARKAIVYLSGNQATHK